MKRLSAFLALSLVLLPALAFGQAVESYPNATSPLTGTERILGAQASSYPCTNCTVNITPLQIADFTAAEAANYGLVYNNNGSIAGLVPTATGQYCLEWTALNAAPTLVTCTSGSGSVSDGSGTTTANEVAVSTSTAHTIGYATTLPTSAFPAVSGDVTIPAGTTTATVSKVTGVSGTANTVSFGNNTSGTGTIEEPAGVALGTLTYTLPTVSGIFPVITGTITTGDCAKFASANSIEDAGAACGSGSMVYPGAGIAVSTGTAWGTSDSTSGSGTTLALTTSPTLVTPILTGYATASLPTCNSSSKGSLAYTTDGTPSFAFCNGTTWSSNGGTTFTAAGTGCTVSGITGDATGGSFVLGAGPCTSVTVTFNGATGMSAPHMWVCSNSDQTLQGGVSSPTANTPTTAITGGSLAGATYYYVITATNAYGEALKSNEVSIASSTLAAPVANTPTTATTGGTLAAGTYYYKITTLGAAGETIGSNEESITTTGTTSTVTITWGAVTGASGYRVYRGTTAGGENTYYAPGNVTTFTDTGAAGTAGSVPASNTAYSATNENTITWATVTGATGYRVYRGTAAAGENTYYAVSGGSTATFTDTGAAGTAASPPASNTTIAWFGTWGQSASTTTAATIPIPPAAGPDQITFSCTPH